MLYALGRVLRGIAIVLRGFMFGMYFPLSTALE